MILLTKFTGEEFMVNPDMIKTVEDCGDTMITYVTGERVLVRETLKEIRERFMQYKSSVGGDPAFVVGVGSEQRHEEPKHVGSGL